ncbi:LysR family transcriptional regulator [Novosphingobium sp. PhB165]|uniref:LysR family transcriptional regulator n=1 Tax=Novosphingobium sp. PhB165 TaxID=2485105 RepID=UPI0010F0FD07|nr:LysR family transcriptional regulator [Novosphingobium sp. PhB165]TCM12732.1 LysR family transcriptional regulator [Novosphingobium sp. PhB165]
MRYQEIVPTWNVGGTSRREKGPLQLRDAPRTSRIMQIGRSDLADFSYFLAIARHRNFRLAGLELGVSASALSHALKGLETRLGVRLLNRTNRSVTLTAAGAELQAAISGPFEAIAQAADILNRYRDAPTGRIRLNVPTDAALLLLAPVLPVFVDRYPDVEIDISASNRLIDVIEGGFDAGIRYGGTVPEDMIAQRLSADIRWVVAGSPAYLDKHGTPETPADLKDHRCLRFRLGDDRIYRWEFERDGEEVEVDVPGALTLDDSPLILSLLTGGAGLMYGPEPLIAPYVEAGQARWVLEEWASPGSGYHIYYSSRHQLPSGLRLLIDLIRELRPLGL